jgi:carnosine N-methyltransferase
MVHGHWFSHQRSNDSLFRSIPFPNAIDQLTHELVALRKETEKGDAAKKSYDEAVQVKELLI